MVLRDHPDDDPAHPFEHLQTLDVSSELPAVGPMLIAVVLDRDHGLLPTQIEVSKRNTVGPQHRYLCLRPGEASVQEQ